MASSSSGERLDNSGGFMSEDTDDGDFDPNNPSQSTPGGDDGNMGPYGPALERERGRNASPTSSAGDGAPLERIVSRDFPHNDYYMVAEGLNRNPNWTVYPAQLAVVLKACAQLAEDVGFADVVGRIRDCVHGDGLVAALLPHDGRAAMPERVAHGPLYR